MRVLKHPVPIDDQWHNIGNGLPVLVGEQGDIATALVWTVVTEGYTGEDWHARVFGTGHEVPDNATHLGSYQDPRGLVWHVFSLTEKEIP